MNFTRKLCKEKDLDVTNSLNAQECYSVTNGYTLKIHSNKCCKSSSRLSRKSLVQVKNGTKLFERMLINNLVMDIETVTSDLFCLPIVFR